MKKIRWAIVFAVFFILFVIIESQTKFIHRLYDDVILDNQNHYLPCSKQPTEDHVNEILSSHQDTIRAILDVNPGNVGVEVDTGSCPGKADLVIWYASHQDRIAIQEIVKGDYFYGVPLRLQNR